MDFSKHFLKVSSSKFIIFLLKVSNSANEKKEFMEKHKDFLQFHYLVILKHSDFNVLIGCNRSTKKRFRRKFYHRIIAVNLSSSSVIINSFEATGTQNKKSEWWELNFSYTLP